MVLNLSTCSNAGSCSIFPATAFTLSFPCLIFQFGCLGIVACLSFNQLMICDKKGLTKGVELGLIHLNHLLIGLILASQIPVSIFDFVLANVDPKCCYFCSRYIILDSNSKELSWTLISSIATHCFLHTSDGFWHLLNMSTFIVVISKHCGIIQLIAQL